MNKKAILAELKPCPFCGNKAEMIERGNDYTRKRAITVKCVNRKCRVQRTDAAIKSGMNWLRRVAVDGWNDRQILTAHEWISVEDRLPEAEGYYLVFDNTVVEHDDAWAIWHFDGERFDYMDYFPMVTHWQPLPPTPKEGEE